MKLYRFYYRNVNPYEITPPQAIRTVLYPPYLANCISHAKNISTDFAPLVHAVMWISLVLKYLTYSVLNCPKVEFYTFSWNQLVTVTITYHFAPTLAMVFRSVM